MANDVEIRFSVREDRKTFDTASYSAGWRSIDEVSDRERSRETQSEKISRMRRAMVEEDNAIFRRMESRFEYRMKRMGSRLVGSAIGQEIGAALGVHDSFMGRLGESAIEGGMMGGAPGAAIRVAMTLIHGTIDAIKSQHEEIQALKERLKAEEEKQFKNWLDFAVDENTRRREQAEQLEELKDQFRREYRDYIANSAKLINSPYLGITG